MSEAIPIKDFLAHHSVPISPFTEEALASRFAGLHEKDFRYVSPWGQWFFYDGARWQPEKTKLATDKARLVCRDAAAQCNEPRTVMGILSKRVISAVESLSQSDRKIAATVDQWDSDIWSLNTPDGVLNLKTGKMRSHSQTDYFTKLTGAGPSGECPNWLKFLDRVTGNDVDLVTFLQRVTGYCLSGDVSAHALFFLFGTGANGKSVFIDTVAGILADYQRTAPIETFTATPGDRHPTDLAGLRGARLVTAVETEEGRRWAESRIKTMTGGDRISARFMRQDFFEYTPQFKLLIAGNHKPGLRSVDEAIRRRFHLVPFAVTIPKEERDPYLKDKLKSEWPGILSWAVKGCLDWQRQGLNPPKAVTDATAAYLEQEDSLAAWILECCETNPNSREGSLALFSNWKNWAEKTGEFAGTNKRFAQNLEARGFHRSRSNTGQGFLGLRLKETQSNYLPGSN